MKSGIEVKIQRNYERISTVQMVKGRLLYFIWSERFGGIYSSDEISFKNLAIFTSTGDGFLISGALPKEVKTNLRDYVEKHLDVLLLFCKKNNIKTRTDCLSRNNGFYELITARIKNTTQEIGK